MKKKLISAKDIEDLIHKGGDIESLSSDAIYTPLARDLLWKWKATPVNLSDSKMARSDNSQNKEKSFNVGDVEALKKQICDIGYRLWVRAYVDGAGGNIAVRIGENSVLCTPTMMSKGFMKPEDMCVVDLEGSQKAGTRKCTSEILTHLSVMKAQSKAKATVHAHPPYATAFAVAGVKPPTCIIPEIEVFVGEIPIAQYETPGTSPVGEHIAKLVEHHQVILMANHGIIAWGNTIEDAYFKIEMVESYCRMVVIATHLGVDLKTFSPSQLQDLLKIKQKIGVPDRRIGLKECELCDNDDWRPGVTCTASQEEQAMSETNPEAEAVVQAVTDIIMQKIK